MKVACCTQAINRTTDIAINLMARITVDVDGQILKLEEDAVDTALLYEFFDNLFDSLNSVGRSPNVLRRP
ncbi:hypothetical protein ILUMI_18266, partial [Ignelater luminosus]